jgi:hypothetical protein
MKARWQDVDVNPNEDLNIYRNISRILEYCWFDIERFPSVEDIAETMGYCTRHVSTLARMNNLPHRGMVTKEIRNASNKKSTQVRTEIRL